jgi:hypothetical protein
MSCYCKENTHNGIFFWNVIGATWKDFDEEGIDANNYCMGWYRN